jgi:hypothetical protein
MEAITDKEALKVSDAKACAKSLIRPPNSTRQQVPIAEPREFSKWESGEDDRAEHFIGERGYMHKSFNGNSPLGLVARPQHQLLLSKDLLF